MPIALGYFLHYRKGDFGTEKIQSKSKKKINKSKILSQLKDFSCTVPALIFLIVFTYYPIFELLRISFTNWNLIKEKYDYVGLKNWVWLFRGSGTQYLLNALKVTVLYTIGEISITLVLGMLFALLFNRMTKSFAILRAIVFVPRYVAMSTAAVIFIWILNEDAGVLNYFLSLAHINKIGWLSNKNTALISVLMLTGWRSVGYGMMIYLSSMNSITRDYYEAAALDGANAVQSFFKITLPLLSPITLFLFVTTFISSMKVFQSVDVLTGGGPYRSTEVIVYLIYKYAFTDFRIDRAATIAVFFFVVLLIFTAATMKISNKSVHYES